MPVTSARQIKTIGELKKKLKACTDAKDPKLSKLLPIGLLTSFLANEKVIPIGYGGMAIEYYLSGSHSSNDIDLWCSHPERLAEVLCAADFRRDSEFFRHTYLPVPIHLMDDLVELDDRFTSVSVNGYNVYINTVEQSILEYTHKFIEGGDNLEPVFVADLIEQYKAKLDFPELLERASDYGKAHYHVLRAIIALKTGSYFTNP